MMGVEGNDGLRTVECLRARLLAERVASKAAKAQADFMAKKVEELERQLAEERKSMDRAEKRMKYALKMLKSLKLSHPPGRSNPPESSEDSSASSSCFPGYRVSEYRDPDSSIGDSGQCSSREGVGEMPRVASSRDFSGGDGSGDSSVSSFFQVVSQDGSLCSTGTGSSLSKENPQIGELSIADVRECTVNKPDPTKHQPNDRRDQGLASSRSGSGYRESRVNNGAHGALKTPRHVREQGSMRRRGDHNKLFGLELNL